MSRVHGRGWRRGFLAGLWAVMASSGFAQTVDVSPSGMPGYSYAITMPPGIAGMAPNIGLAYTGGGVNGPVGYGWSLQGISTITRCPYSRATDGVTRGVSFDGDDKLCLDGQRLIQIDPATGGVVNAQNTAPSPSAPFQQGDALGLSGGVREYRTEKDTYTRVRAYGMAGSAQDGPKYFRVWTKSGQVYEYGNNANASANAVVTAQGKTVTSAWLVSRIADTLGNYIDFQYQQRDIGWGSSVSVDGGAASTIGHEWNLAEIRYTGTAGGTLPQNRVVFVYEDRAVGDAARPQDRAEAFQLGSRNLSVQRLTQIRTEINIQSAPIAVKTIQLTYGQGSRSGRSLLQQLRECAGTSARCLPGVSFAYTGGGGEVYMASPGFNLGTTSLSDNDRGVLAGDFNGDGKTDLLLWSTNSANNVVYLSKGDGSFTPVSFVVSGVTNIQLFSDDGCYQSSLADVNGDGLPDIIRYSGPNRLDGQACPAHGDTEIYLSDGAGGFTKVPYQGPALTMQASKDVSDCLVPRNPTTGICTEPAFHAGWTAGASFLFFDVDGDGIPDLVTTVLPAYGNNAPKVDACLSQVCTRVFKGDGHGGFNQELATNLAHVSIYEPPKFTGGFGTPNDLVDLDGDGLADLNGLPIIYFNQVPAFRSRGDGNFDPLPMGQNCAFTLDYNGDGRSDCLLVQSGAGTATLNTVMGRDKMGQVGNFNLGSTVLKDLKHWTQIVDVNQDGRQDILRVSDNPIENALFYSNGDGSFTQAPSFNFATVALRSADGTNDFLTGDFTGHGNTEFLRLHVSPSAGSDATRNVLYVKTDPAPPDLLKSVTSGTGLRTDLTWVPLGNTASGALGERYASDRGTPNQAVYPRIDAMAPTFVVATVASDTGVGNARSTSEYFYAGFKTAYDGRGSEGFREFRKQSPAPDGVSQLVVATRFLQSHPYIGVASESATWIGGLKDGWPLNPLSTTRNTYCNAAAASAAANANYLVPCAVPAGTYVVQPYLAQSVESGQDLAGIALPTVTTTNVYNTWGDPTQISVVTTGTSVDQQQTVTKTTTNVYDAPLTDCASDTDCHWIAGRLLSATQQNTVPALALTPSAGNAPFAAATSGSAALPRLSFGTTALDFGNQRVGGTYVSSAVALVNGGAVDASNVRLSLPAGFTLSDNSCGSTLAANSSCAFTVTWTPTAVQSYAGTLSASSGNASIGNSIVLSGNAVQPAASLSATLAFADVQVGKSATQTATLSNTGLIALDVGTPAAAVSGTGYSLSANACGASLAPGASCAITVAFAPGATGASSGSLTIGTSAGTQTAALSANGVQARLSFSPASLDFGTGQTGDSHASSPITLSNNGNVAASGLTLAAPAGYAVTSSNCDSALAAGASCSFTVTWTPTAVTTYAGAVTAATSSGIAQNSLAVTGTARAPSATVTGALAFGSVVTGRSGTQTAQLTNTGIGVLTLTPPGAAQLTGAGFSIAGTSCGTTLAAGASCTVDVSFAPAAAGAAAGSLNWPTGAGSFATSLGGTGTRAQLTLSPSSLSWGIRQVGSSYYGTTPVTMTNSGDGPALDISYTATDPFSVSPTDTNCGATLAAGTSCTMTMLYSPRLADSSNGTLTVGTSTGSVANTVSLMGSGVRLVAVFAPDLNFGELALGASATGTMHLSNDGTADFTFSQPGSDSVSGTGFSFVSTTCRTSLTTDHSCDITVRFQPTALGATSGTVTLNSNAGTLVRTLTGTGVQAQLAFSPAALNWGSQQVGGSYGSSAVTLTNSGNTAATSVALSAPSGFAISGSNCGSSLGAGASCSFTVTWTPAAMQAYGGSVTASSANAVVSNAVSLSGTGVQAQLSFNPAALNWGSQLVNSAYGSSAVTLTNVGNTAAAGMSLASTNGSFAIAGSNCGGSLGAGQSCSFSVTWSPTAVQAYSGQIVAGLSNGVALNAVSLSGSAASNTTAITASPTSLSFSVAKGLASSTSNVTVTNTGQGTATNLNWPLQYTSGTATIGAFPIHGGTCVSGGSLAAGASCTIGVSYSGNCTAGNRTATLTVQGNNFPAATVSLQGSTGGGVCH